jgi:hypothetical protein
MSSLEQSSALYQQELPVLGVFGNPAGTYTTAATRSLGNLIKNLNGTSHITGIVRVAAGGVPGIPTAVIIRPTTADNLGGTLTTAVYQLAVYSSNPADTSQYRVFWTNSYEASDYVPDGVTPAGSVVVTVPAQYAP